jgi:hypothetical protein
METVQSHWDVIAANIWLFASWTVGEALIVWAAIHFLYKRRLDDDGAEIQRLRARLSDQKSDAGTASATVGPDASAIYEYPDAGDNGINILGHAVTDLVVGKTYSMAATIPTGGRLKLLLAGTAPRYLEEMPGGWHFSVSTRNWQHNLYDQGDHTQWFTARSGEADLAFIPARPGQILVRVFEGGHEQAWEKVLKVIAG